MATTLEEFAQLEPLWDKSIQSPGDISLGEKHLLMEWLPLDEMQANANRYLGMSVEDLFRKAGGDPHSLTYPECRLIRHNFRIIGILDQGDRFSWRWKRPDLYTKRNQAREGVLTSTELYAVQGVEEIF